MDSVSAVSPKIHYHIRWLASDELDWERHDTRAQAEEAANQLSRPHEQYSVERFEENCVRCQKLASTAKA
jgi:hypothetical protein